MAPPKADTGRATHGNTKRSTPVVPRIIPAVPLAFSRPSNASKAKNGANHATEKVSSAVHDDVNGKPMTSPEHTQILPDTNGSEETASDAPASVVSEPSEPVQDHQPEKQNGSTNGLEPEGKPPPQIHTQTNATSRVPYELPPPFYPAENRSTPTPTSATSSAPPPNLHMNNVTMQHPQPKPNHIVFGGYADSSNTSPAPPPRSSGMMPFQPPPPPSNFAPPFFPGHSHHFSDSHIGPMYPPPPMGPPHGYRREQPPNTGRQQQPWYSPAGAPYNGGHNEFIPFSPNGVTHDSRSPSQSSSKAQDQDPQRNEVRPQHYAQPIMNGLNSPINDHRSIAALFHLRDWLISQVDNPEFADYILEISYSPAAKNFLIPVHGIIVARSPALRALLTTHGSAMLQPQGPKLIKLSVPARYFNSDSYKDALRVLYGAPLLGSIGIEPLPPFDLETPDNPMVAVAQDRMDRALAYLIAGHFLADPAVLANGTEIVTSMLRWDTIEKALDLVLDRTFNSSDASQSSANNSSSSDGSPGFPPTSFPGVPREHLLQNILEFLSKSIPSDFKVNTTAPQMVQSPLLPEIDSRPRKHRAKLSQIRFGEMLPDTSNTVIFITNLTSTILFSLPFHILKRLLEDPTLESRLGQAALAKVAKLTIEERESRRKKVARSPPNQEKLEGLRHLWPNTLYEERVEPSNQTRSGFQLSRQIDSQDAPAQNGTHKP